MSEFKLLIMMVDNSTQIKRDDGLMSYDNVKIDID